jgi:hypothetical protein
MVQGTGILTGGGTCPHLNAVIRVSSAERPADWLPDALHAGPGTGIHRIDGGPLTDSPLSKEHLPRGIVPATPRTDPLKNPTGSLTCAAGTAAGSAT